MLFPSAFYYILSSLEVDSVAFTPTRLGRDGMHWRPRGGVSGTQGGEPSIGNRDNQNAESSLASTSCCCDRHEADFTHWGPSRTKSCGSGSSSMGGKNLGMAQYGQVSTEANQLCPGAGSCVLWWKLGPSPMDCEGYVQKRDESWGRPLTPR